jgi:hypothetical protein
LTVVADISNIYKADNSIVCCTSDRFEGFDRFEIFDRIDKFGLVVL